MSWLDGSMIDVACVGATWSAETPLHALLLPHCHLHHAAICFALPLELPHGLCHEAPDKLPDC